MVGECSCSTSPFFSLPLTLSFKFLLIPQEHPQQLPSPTVCLFWALWMLLLLLPLLRKLLLLSCPLGDIWRWPNSTDDPPLLHELSRQLLPLLRLYSWFLWLLLSECCTIFSSKNLIPNVLLATRSFTLSHFILLLYGQSCVIVVAMALLLLHLVVHKTLQQFLFLIFIFFLYDLLQRRSIAVLRYHRTVWYKKCPLFCNLR